MIEILSLLPADGRVVLTIAKGVITAVRPLHSDHYIATLETLIELLQAAGYTVTK